MKLRMLILFAFFSLTAFAEKIPQGKAREIALEFFGRRPEGRSVTQLRMVYDGENAQSRAAGNDPALFVFDNPAGKGFVVVAGDDAAVPVLGYSYDNEFPEGELPPNLEDWLQAMKEQVERARSEGYAPSSRSRSLGQIGDVVVQLKTAQWDQMDPYNRLCPQDGLHRSVTGCLATAVAIIMHYHQWPEKGTGTIPAYTTKSKKIEVPARELGEPYLWDEMLFAYQAGRYSAEAVNQVARLMADVGSLVTMDYSANGSGASAMNVPAALQKYMDYDKSMQICSRYEYTQAQWYYILATELENNRPILYNGYNEEAGHSFVLDGYTSDMYFSVNWGWSGYCNGYFRLDALEPEPGGTGANDEHYNDDQYAVIGIKKNEGGDYVEMLKFGKQGMEASVTEFEQNVPFILSIEAIWNMGGGNFTGELLIALVDAEGDLKQVLNGGKVTELPPLRGLVDLELHCKIDVPIEQGDRIRVYYRSEKTPVWTCIIGGEDCVWELLVSDAKAIDESTVIRYDKQAKKLTVTVKSGVDVSFESSAGTAMDDRMEVSGNDVTIRAEGLPLDTYVLKLKKGAEYKEVKIKLGTAQ